MQYPPPTQSDRPPGQHLLVYDGGCGFCVVAVRRMRRRARVALELLSFDEAARRGGLLTALDLADVRRCAHYITPAGVEYHGGAAVTRALRLGGGAWAFALLDRPPLSVARDVLYGLVARHRRRLARFAGAEACAIDARASEARD